MKRFAVHVGRPDSPAILACDSENRLADIVDKLSMPAYMTECLGGRIVYRNSHARKADNDARRDSEERGASPSPAQ